MGRVVVYTRREREHEEKVNTVNVEMFDLFEKRFCAHLSNLINGNYRLRLYIGSDGEDGMSSITEAVKLRVSKL